MSPSFATIDCQYPHGLGWDCVPSSSILHENWSGLACMGFVYVFTIAVNLYEQLPSCVQKIMLLCSHCQPLALSLFSYHYSVVITASSMGLSFIVPSGMSVLCLGKLWTSVLITIYYKQKLLSCGMRDAIVCGYDNKS